MKRRGFIKGGLLAGLSAAALSCPGPVVSRKEIVTTPKAELTKASFNGQDFYIDGDITVSECTTPEYNGTFTRSDLGVVKS